MKSKNYIPITCSCQLCKKELLTSGLASHLHSSHQDIYPEKPRNYGPCKQCGKDLIGYWKKQFCNSSCAANYTNTLRPPGHPSRMKGNESRREKAIQQSLSKPAQHIYPKKPRVYNRVYTPKVPKALYTKITECKACHKFFPATKQRKTCSTQCKNLIHSIIAKRTLRENPSNLQHRRGIHVSPIAGAVYLESSWEFLVAESLDLHNVKWSRPKYLNYTLDSKRKSYYPDFYLDDFGVYLDPKNPYKYKLDKSKLNAVIAEHGIKLIILGRNELEWPVIKTLVEDERFELSRLAASDLKSGVATNFTNPPTT